MAVLSEPEFLGQIFVVPGRVQSSMPTPVPTPAPTPSGACAIVMLTRLPTLFVRLGGSPTDQRITPIVSSSDTPTIAPTVHVEVVRLPSCCICHGVRRGVLSSLSSLSLFASLLSVRLTAFHAVAR